MTSIEDYLAYILTFDLPPKKESKYNVSLEEQQKGRTVEVIP